MDELGAKILSNLDAAFRKDPKINEYDFLPVMESHLNRNPLIHEHNKLGVEIWAIKLLYRHAYRLLLSSCSASYRHEPDLLQSVTRAVLLINPDCLTAWNARKQLVKRQQLDAALDQTLSSLVLSRHPKSPETYAHRKWLFHHLSTPCSTHHTTISETTSTTNIDSQDCSPFESDPTPVHISTSSQGQSSGVQICTTCDRMRHSVEVECKVCEVAAEHYPNNYNAWSHRIWAIQQLKTATKELLEEEFKSTQKFVSSHVSDHSGLHYRQFLFRHLTHLLPQDEVFTQLQTELKGNTESIVCYPGHEALWCHRRAVLCLLLQTSPKATLAVETGGNNPKKTKRHGALYNKIQQDENNLVQQATNSCQNEWQITLSERHVDWMKKCLQSAYS